MSIGRLRQFCVAGIGLAAVAVGGCSIDVQEGGRGEARKSVDIRTPIGAMSVRTDEHQVETGLAVYPGARPLHERREPSRANVSIAGGRFGLKVIATKFESDAEAGDIIAHYKDSMRAYGEVVECHGDIDFRGPRGDKRPICRRRRSGETQLVVGTESQHRLVAVKPRGDGSEFAVVYVQTRS